MLQRDVRAVEQHVRPRRTGGCTRCPANGTLTTQNVVTVPVSGSSTSSVVGTPSVGQAPRGGM